ncbi:hypothetical protein BRC91_10350 [Halobacteriales archaeon QS_4_62_28]|nr:MAG: hypothetical protein BRC91_10350 [Halobacteriales archaeon QS_4_62_28]
MRILLVTDIHGKSEKLRRIIDTEHFDALLCAGDLSDATWYDDYAENLATVLSILEQSGVRVGAIPGNTDPEHECVDALRSHGMNLHDEVCTWDQFVVAGYGGGIGRTDQPFDPPGDEIRDAMLALHAQMADRPRIAIIHQPPFDTCLDIVESDLHVGDATVRNLFEQVDFDLAVTGHIHESRGQDEVNGTCIVNPGAVMDGYYAVAEIQGRSIDLEMKGL